MSDARTTLERLSDEIERRWAEEGWREEALPDLAAEALRALPWADLDPWELVDDLAERVTLPSQHDPEAKFSDLPITVCRRDRHQVDVLFWTEATTSIHEHGFAGAFAVWRGSSLHVQYAFEQRREHSSYTLEGDLRRLDQERLWPGDARPIRAGRDFVHRLFHYDSPSISVVIRTFDYSPGATQYDYLEAGLALDPFRKLESVERRLRGLRLAARWGPEKYAKLLPDALRDLDFGRLASLTLRQRRLLRAESEAAALEAAGPRRELLAAGLAETRRSDGICALRAQTSGEAARRLTAYMLVASDRESLWALYGDDDPAAAITRDLAALLAELAAAGRRFPELGEDEIEVVSIRMRAADDAEAERTLRDEFGDEDVDELLPDVQALWAYFTEGDPWRVLFR